MDKQTKIKFNLEQLERLAIGIRIQLSNLSGMDGDLKDLLAPILTKLLKAINKLIPSK